MNLKKDVFFEKIKEKAKLCEEGYYELYKNASINANNKKSITYEVKHDQKILNNLSRYSNRSNFYFCVFIGLMMRYTQNEQLASVCVSKIRNQTSIKIVNMPYNNTISFNDQMIQLDKESYLLMDPNWFKDVLDVIVNCAGCYFVYKDKKENSLSLDEDSVGTDILFTVEDTEEEKLLAITYNQDAFSELFISRIAEHYCNLLVYALENAGTSIANADFMSANEKKLLLETWNATEAEFPQNLCTHQLFENRVLEDPEAIAVCYENKSMSRAELNRQSNRLANYLIGLGAKKGDIVALYSNKSIGFVVGIMGILKAGCAYLPIDASYPQSRVEYILTNSKTSAIVATVPIAENQLSVPNVKIIDLTSCLDSMTSLSDKNPNVDVTPKDPCYLIYTSGSTGQPKGVLLNHEGRVNNFNDFNSRFSINAKDKVLAVSSVSFDMSAYDVLGSMMAGSSIVLPDPQLEKQPFHWLELIQKYNITIWHSVPVLLELICKCCIHRETFTMESLRVVLLGGDWIPVTLPDRFRKLNQKARLISLGGATEASMDSIIYYIGEVDSNWKSIPYGRPMCNQKAYVLDTNRQLLPIGIPGELYLGGIGIGEGYYLNPKATEERFFNNPWENERKQRIYKTGDLVYFNDEGNLILLGRMDYQVKINGTRIELGEIEQCISNYPGISRVVAVAPMIGTNRKIVAHVEYKSEEMIPKEKELIEFISKFLPKSHIPAHFMFTSAIPITPNGKVDRKTLNKLAEDYLSKSKDLEKISRR